MAYTDNYTEFALKLKFLQDNIQQIQDNVVL